MWELETRVQQLKQQVTENDGRNIAGIGFMREVDSLIDVFYDDIGEIKSISLKSLFDLFLVKCLYVDRRSRDAAILDYLSDMLTRYLWAREMLPIGLGNERLAEMLISLAEETDEKSHFQNLFEAYRKLADNSLFLVGMFPRSLGRRRYGWRRKVLPSPSLDKQHYIRVGRSYYRLAAEHELAQWIGQRQTLEKLSRYFEIYMDALSDMSETYIMGFDMVRIADKMLDNIKLYRRTGDATYLENAKKYAAILKIDNPNLARFLKRRPRAVIL